MHLRRLRRAHAVAFFRPGRGVSKNHLVRVADPAAAQMIKSTIILYYYLGGRGIADPASDVAPGDLRIGGADG